MDSIDVFGGNWPLNGIFSSDMIEEYACDMSIFLGFLQVLPLFSHTNLCMTSFIKYTMFHKGQGSLCVWIQLGKGIPEREVMKPEKMQAGPHRS